MHSDDVAHAYRLAVTGDVRGPFNIAAEPVLDPPELARLLHARPVRVAPTLLRALAAVSWRLHLQPTPPGWVDLALGVPLLDASRARSVLGWTARVDAGSALVELLQGIHDKAGMDTPPLAPAGGGPFRLRELRTRVGGRSS